LKVISVIVFADEASFRMFALKNMELYNRMGFKMYSIVN
jgi:hypothetical protein